MDVAIELIGEHGVRGFSMAEASRRLGVAVSAPYAHFRDREALLAGAAVRAWQALRAQVVVESEDLASPAARLAAVARSYVRFAGLHKSLFEVAFRAGVDKHRHPELEEAERELTELLLDRVRAVAGPDADLVDDLATAVEATTEGYAMMLFEGDFGSGEQAVAEAAERAGAATLALVRGRRLLKSSPA